MTILKIIRKPSVHLVGKQVVDSAAVRDYLSGIDACNWSTDATPGEELIEIAGRVCYESFRNPRPGGNAAYIQHIKEVAHGSVIEHAVFSLIIAGVSRSLSHELVRHRHFSFSQLSQRYVDEADCAFVMPPAIMALPTESQDVWIEDVDNARGRYVSWVQALLSSIPETVEKTERRKRAREAARSLLPNATETKIFVTGNAREWRWFLELRASRYADAEIRRLALCIYDILLDAAPNLFSDYEKVPLPDGTYELTTKCRKV